jgi:small subunit ribosomal protein S14
MRLYHRGAAFCKKMRGKLRKMSEKLNIRDHKHRLLAAKYELRRKLYKAFCKDPDLPSDMRDKHRYKLSKLPIKSSFARVRNRCIFTGRPRWSSRVLSNFSYRFSWISISRFFDGHKEIVLVATTKPIEQGLALQLVYKQGK